MEPKPELPHRKSSSSSTLKLLESELREKPTPAKALEYTKELLKEIANEQLSQQDKKKEHDLAVREMVKWCEKKFAKNIHLHALVIKLNLLRVRHLFMDMRLRMVTILHQKKEDEEERRDEKREQKENEELLEQERKREAEQLAAELEQSKKQEAPKPTPTPGQPLTPQENANDMADNISDLTNLMSGLLSMTAGGSMFSAADQDKMKLGMIDLDTLDLSPDEFEKKLFELVDHVDQMFNKARATVADTEKPLIDVFQKRIGEDFTKWISTGQLPRYTDADRTNIRQSMQNAKLHPEAAKHGLQKIRDSINPALVAQREHLATQQLSPKGGGTAAKPLPSARQTSPSDPLQAQNPEGPESEKRPKRPREFDPRATPTPKGD